MMMRDNKPYGRFYEQYDASKTQGATPETVRERLDAASDLYGPSPLQAGVRARVDNTEWLLKVPAGVGVVIQKRLRREVLRSRRISKIEVDEDALIRRYDLSDPQDEADLRALMASREWTPEDEAA